jgi:hypothetical protein
VHTGTGDLFTYIALHYCKMINYYHLGQNHFAESNRHVLTFLHPKFTVQCTGGVALQWLKLKISGYIFASIKNFIHWKRTWCILLNLWKSGLTTPWHGDWH